MPELPEVEATRVLLAKATSGRRVVDLSGDPTPDGLRDIVGEVIGPWRRVGKQLAAAVGAGHLTLHLGMTGKIVVNPPADRRFLRVRLGFDDGTHVGFVDTRRLGAMSRVGPDVDPFAHLGPDALALVLDAADPGAALARCISPSNEASRHRGSAVLKDRALDQHRVAGIGNIAIIEACHRAGVHPHARAATLSEAAWSAVATGLREHLTETLADCLATDEVQYVSEGGPNPFGVYGRMGETCPRCEAAAIERLARQGRPTFVCPGCQPLVS